MRGVLCIAGLSVLLTGGLWGRQPDEGHRKPFAARIPAERSAALAARLPDWRACWSADGVARLATGPSRAIGERRSLGESDLPALIPELLAVAGGVADGETVVPTRMEKIGPLWYVSLSQELDGMPVLFAGADFRLWEDGRLMAFRSTLVTGAQRPDHPRLSPGDAVSEARTALGLPPSSMPIAEPRMAMLPERAADGTRLHAVYVMEWRDDGVPARNLVAIDATDGRLRLRINRLRHGESRLRVRGTVAGNDPSGPFVERSFPDLTLHAENRTWHSARDGLARIRHDRPVTVQAELSGRAVRISDGGGRSAAAIAIPAGADVILEWHDGNAHPAARTAYYYLTDLLNRVSEDDPHLLSIWGPLECRVNLPGDCNAFWDGDAVNFYGGDRCPNTALMPSIVRHEMGHALNDRVYRAGGGAWGMLNGALHEGLADATAALAGDDPRIGVGMFGPGTVLRDISLPRSYPDDLSGFPHHDGLILAGALWDLRQRVGTAVARRLLHRARWGRPDDLHTGRAFADWLLELLLVDDDDGDLGNGTPHGAAILAAFAGRGIAIGELFAPAFHHDPPGIASAAPRATTIAFQLGRAGLPLDSVGIEVVHEGSADAQWMPARREAEDHYRVDLPVLVPGQFLHYAIVARDRISGKRLRFPEEGDGYPLAAGYTLRHLDDLRSPGGWVAGDPDDDATAGGWEWGTPEATANGGQPGGDHTSGAGACFVTGASAGQGSEHHDLDGGRTTLYSPVYESSSGEAVLLAFYLWFSNDRGGGAEGDAFAVAVRDGNTGVWRPLTERTRSTRGWERILLPLPAEAGRTGALQFRFTAADHSPESQVEALVDDVAIYAFTPEAPRPESALLNSLPTTTTLHPPHPNPFNGESRIRLDLAEGAALRMVLYDLLGRPVRRLEGGWREAGRHDIRWDGQGESGRVLPSGVYLLRVSVATPGEGEMVRTRRLVLVR